MQPTIDIMARQGSGATRLSEVVYSDSSVHHKELMGDEYVELKFSVPERVRILAGDFVAIPGTGTFYANEEAWPQRNRNTGGWDYEVRFFAHWKRWGNHKLMYDRQAGGELSWSLTSTALNFLSIVKSNLRALGYVGEDFSTAVSPAADEAEELAKMKYIKFEDADILSALKQIAEAWDTEYLITEHGITLGRVEYGSEVLLQENDNINPISTRRGSKERATRLYAFGSDRNLTKNYRKNESSPEAIEAVVERRLKLPAGTPYVDYPDNLDPNDVVEAVCVFDDIYPRFISTITEVQPLDRVKEEEVVKEDGKFETVEKHWTVYRFRCDITGFKRDYILEREELKITFNPGSNANPQHVCRLGGMEFAVAWNPEGVYDEDSYEAQWWEIVANEDYGIELPAPGFAPQIGDQFVLTGFNIEALSDPGDPLGYVRSAEQELLAEARKKAAKLAIDDTVYTCPTNPVRCAGYVPQPGGTFSHDVSREVDLDIGQAVKLRRAGEEDRSSRVRAFDKKLANRYDCEYQVGESAAYSRTGELAGKLQEMKMGGFGFSLGSGSGSSVYLIKRHDSTPASDFNAFSALRSRSEFLSKSSPDTAQEPIKFDKHLTTGEYSQGLSGGYFGQTANGSLSEVDFLKVRKKAQFETLEIQHVKGAGGKIVLSAGDGCEITGVQQVNGGWRCFYKGREEGEDGSVQRIVPFFQPGDQIISRTSNAATSSGAIALENRYWWRLCTAVGEGWFELSASDCDHGSDAPLPGDSCAHLGNHGSQALGIAEDKTRQGAVTLSTTEPSSEAVVTVLSGIDSYSLEGRDAVTMGVDSDGLPCLYVYGRAYVGPRDQSTYVKYEPGQGVQIKGSLSVDSTVGGDTLEGYVGGIAEEATAQAEADAAEALAKAEQASQDALSARDRLDLWMQDGKITKIEARSLADELQRVREDWEYFVAEYAQFGAGMPAGAQTKKEAYENMLATLSTFGQNEEAKDIPAGFQDAMEAWYAVRTTMLEELANFARAYADSKAQNVDGKYAYLKAALEGSTTINGGLVLTSVVSVSDGDGRSNAGLSGIVMDGSSAERPSRPGGGIAFWAGGDMEDLLSYYHWDDNAREWKPNTSPLPDGLRIAQAVDRMDGTGYRAGGNLWWDASGKVHADPMSFFVGEQAVGAMMQLFRLNYAVNAADQNFGNVKSATPMKPFTSLTFSGQQGENPYQLTLENGVLHFHGSLYADGFISAFGLNAEAGGGGLDVERMWEELAGRAGSTQIAAQHLTEALGGLGCAVTTSGTVTAPVFVGELQGNAATATSALTAQNADLATEALTAQAAQRLSSSVTIWGQSFDGTADVTGDLTFDNNTGLCWKDSGGTARRVMKMDNYGVEIAHSDVWIETGGDCYLHLCNNSVDIDGYEGVHINKDSSDGEGLFIHSDATFYRNLYIREGARTIEFGFTDDGHALINVGDRDLDLKATQFSLFINGGTIPSIYANDTNELYLNSANEVVVNDEYPGSVFEVYSPSTLYKELELRDKLVFKKGISAGEIRLDGDMLVLQRDNDNNICLGPLGETYIDGSTFVCVNSGFPDSSSFQVYSEAYFDKTLRIGEATLEWDNSQQALKINKGFYSEKWISAYGASASASGGGLDTAELWAQLGPGNSNQIDPVHLSQFYTKSAVDGLLALYAPLTALDGYLPLAGGTLTGDLVMSNNTALKWKNSSGQAKDVMYAQGNYDIIIQSRDTNPGNIQLSDGVWINAPFAFNTISLDEEGVVLAREFNNTSILRVSDDVTIDTEGDIFMTSNKADTDDYRVELTMIDYFEANAVGYHSHLYADGEGASLYWIFNNQHSSAIVNGSGFWVRSKIKTAMASFVVDGNLNTITLTPKEAANCTAYQFTADAMLLKRGNNECSIIASDYAMELNCSFFTLSTDYVTLDVTDDGWVEFYNVATFNILNGANRVDLGIGHNNITVKGNGDLEIGLKAHNTQIYAKIFDIETSEGGKLTLDETGATELDGYLWVSQGITTPELTIGDATLSWNAAAQALKINKPVYSEGWMSAYGLNPSASSGGLDTTQLWAELGASGTSQIHASHLTAALTPYATTADVQGMLTGYTDTAGVNSLLAGYLPLAGGTLTGALTAQGVITSRFPSASNPQRVEICQGQMQFYHHTPYIDFHYGSMVNGTYSRIICESDGTINCSPKFAVRGSNVLTHGELSFENANGKYRPMQFQNLDLSALDINTFYPVVFLGSYVAHVRLKSESFSSSAAYNQNGIDFYYDNDGWGDLKDNLYIREYFCYDNREITIGCIGRGTHQGGLCAIWLRGGLRYYAEANITLNLKTVNYTENEQIFTIGPNYNGSWVSGHNVNIAFTPQSTIESGSYSEHPIKASSFIGNLDGNATKDGDGNVITNTYVKKSGDTMTGALTIAPTNTSGRQEGLVLYDAGGGTGEGLYIQWKTGKYKDGIKLWPNTDLTNLRINEYDVLHSSNYTTYVTQSYINGLSIDAATLGGTALGSLLSSVSLGTDGAVSVTVGGSTKTSSAASGTWGISVTGNAATATKLATARSLWGNAFDGTADVTGAIKFASVEYINGTVSLLTVGNATSGKSLTLTSGGTTTLSGVTTTISAGNNASISAVGDLSLSSTNSKILANSDVKIASGKRLYFKDDAHYIELTNDGFHFSHGVYSDSFVTAFGVGTSSGGGGGLDTVQMWQELAANTNNQIHASHLSNALSGYVQSSELTGYVNTSTAQDVGGVKTFTQQPTVKLTSAPRICYKAANTAYGYIGCNAANVPTFWASAGTDPKTLLHEDNFGSYVTKAYVDGLGIDNFSEWYTTILSEVDDTTANWHAKKNCVTHYNTDSKYTLAKPTPYGILVNFYAGISEVHQLWMQQSCGSIYHRSGDNKGWKTNGWVKMLDAENFSSVVDSAYVQGIVTKAYINGLSIDAASADVAEYATAIRHPLYNNSSTRLNDINLNFTDAGLHYFLATTSCSTANGRPYDGCVLHAAWDNGYWNSQLLLPNSASESMAWRTSGSTQFGTGTDAQKAAQKWRKLIDDTNLSSYVTKSYVDGLGINAATLGGTSLEGLQTRLYAYDHSAAAYVDSTLVANVLAMKNNSTLMGNGAWRYYDTKFYGSVKATSNRTQMAYGYDSDVINFRRYYNGMWYDWKTVAFTDSNVASATYATTAGSAGHANTATNFDHMVSIWGQSFTGNSGISGDMTGVGSITMSDDLIMGGDLYMANTKSLRFADSGGTYREAMGYTNSNLLRIGYGQFASASSAYDTQINGKVLHLRSGANTESIKDTTIDENGWLNPYANIGMKNNAAIYSKTSDGTSNAQMLKLSNGDLMMIGNTGFETNYYGGAEISFGGHHGKYGIRILTEQDGGSWISKVGIDKWTPECSLHVGGNTKIDGTLTVTGQGWFKEHVNIELNKGFKWSNALLIQGFMGSGGPSLTMGISTTAGIVTLQGIGISINAPLNGVSVSGNLSATGGITAMAVTSSSDIRLKENIRPLELSASQVAMLPAVEYDWRDGSGRDCGTIAQQMAAVLPLCVKANSDGMLTVDYGKAGLLSAIAVAKEHGNRIAELEARVSALEEENSYLRAQIAN